MEGKKEEERDIYMYLSCLTPSFSVVFEHPSPGGVARMTSPSLEIVLPEEHAFQCTTMLFVVPQKRGWTGQMPTAYVAICQLIYSKA